MDQPLMTAPAQTSSFASKEKNPNLELVPPGLQPAIIYGVVNIGTQDGEYQGRATASNKLKLVLEIPGHRQLYWKDDTIPSPSAMIMDFNYSISKNNKTGKKTKLLELIETLFGPLQASQYLSFNVSQLAGLKVFVNIAHYLKQDGKVGAKVESISSLNPAYVDPNSLVLTNKILIYGVQMGFENLSFASLPYFYRSLIKQSHEGKAHAAAGGRFTKLDEAGNIVIDDGSNDYTSAPLGKIVMINPQYTYEQLKSNGWTDQQMIDNGYAKREAVAPIPAPQAMPQQAPVYQSPQAPMAMQPQMPTANVNPTQPMLVMIDKSAPYEAWIANGWTDALLVEKGKAMMMPAQNTVFPPTPQAQPLPPPVAIPQAIPQGIPTPQPTASALFSQTPVAPVQQLGAPPLPPQAIPQAPISSFQQVPTPMQGEAPPDDLPF
jgi:hypothetical protein